MSGLSKNELQNVFRGALEPVKRELLCALQSQNLNLTVLCDTGSGDPVAFVSVYYNTKTNTVTPIFLDLDYNVLPDQPASTEPCV